MKIFSDIPEVYMKRLSRMYRKNIAHLKACPNLYKINHLVKPCALCSRNVRQIFEKAKSVRLADRRYTVHDGDAWETFCLKAMVNARRSVYTSIEFPTPKLVYRGTTRIPQFYEPSTDTLLDCFPSEADLQSCDMYFLNHAYKVCSSIGLYYHQVVVDKDMNIVTRTRQPRDIDEDLLFQKLYRAMKQVPHTESGSKPTDLPW